MTLGRVLFDETSFAFLGEDPHALEVTFDALMRVFDAVEESGERISTWSEIWNIESSSGIALWSRMFGEEPFGVDRDILRRLLIKLERLTFWDLDDEIEIHKGVEFGDGRADVSPTLARAALERHSGRAIATIVVDAVGRSGRYQVAVIDSGENSSLFIVDRVDLYEKFWRDALTFEPKTVAALSELCVRAFQRLCFVEGVWRQFGAFEGAFNDVLPRFLAVLAGLNDHAVEVWAEYSQPHEIIANMSARAHVDCSPENSNTRANKAAMRERLVVFEGEALVMLWHAKLEPHRNRIHFDTQTNRVIVGILAKHLRT